MAHRAARSLLLALSLAVASCGGSGSIGGAGGADGAGDATAAKDGGASADAGVDAGGTLRDTASPSDGGSPLEDTASAVDTPFATDAPQPDDAGAPPSDGTAPDDAPAPPDDVPDDCTPVCADRTCGDDGCGGVCGCPEPLHRCAAGVCVAPAIVINEILASNDAGLEDEDGDSSDWIELYSREEQPISLDGWFLTDDPLALGKWRFPAVTIRPNEVLLVFASGKDRAAADGALHTSFSLSSGGEYLALVMPDGATIASSFDPAFPGQFEDVSYGVTQAAEPTPLISFGDVARYHVPVDGALGTAWLAPDFDDAGWAEGPVGLGFQLADAPHPFDAPNIAEGRETTQTSVFEPHGSGGAVDGDGQSFFHTLAEDWAPAWEVDLGGSYWLSAVELHNRPNCCLSRLRDVTVHVLDEAREEVFTSEIVNPGNERFDRRLGEGPIRWDIDLYGQGGVLGRHVRLTRAPDPDLYGTRGEGNEDEVAVLSLAEVVVRGGHAEAFPEVATDVGDDVYARSTSLYVRVPFDLAQAAAVQVLTLTVHYDAGFVVWLNGERVAERYAPPALTWDAAATGERAGVAVAADIDLTGWRDLLRASGNVLAIQALNSAPDDDDLVILPELVARRVEDGDRAFFREPTPGLVNETPAFAGFVATPVVDPPHGFHDAPIEVTLTSDTPDAAIYYTLDATPPTEEAGALYEGPFTVEQTTVLRAIAVAPDHAPSDVTTTTWLFLDDVVAQDRDATVARGFPEAWGTIAPDYGMDARVVAQDGSDAYDGRYAATIRDDLEALPSLSLVLPADQLFGPDGIYTQSTQRGVEFERAASLELIVPDGWPADRPGGLLAEDGEPPGFQIDCGVRIQGGAFRRHDLTKKHSFRVLFKSLYGPTKLRYPLFGDGATDRFDTLTLRANSNDGWQWKGAGAKPLYIRDRFGRDTALDMGVAASHGAFFHLYVDGVYWGVYEAVERPDHSFSATYLRGDKDEWDSVSNGEASNGDMAAWDTLVELARGGLTSDAAYNEVLGRTPDGVRDEALPVYLDQDNLIDYMLVNLYVGNTDWPHHNYWVGCHRDLQDGFQFYMWDSEWSMGIRSDLDTNQIAVDRGVAVPWSAIKDHPEFQLRFADRVQRAFFHGGPLYVDPEHPEWDPAHPERNRPAARLAALAARIERGLVAESARWGDQHEATPYTVDEHWRVEVDRLLRDYFPQRSARVLQQFRDAGLYPATPAPTIEPFGGAVPAGLPIRLATSDGVVHYTTDGSDPRRYGGAVAPGALGGTASMELPTPAGAGTLVVRARTFQAGAWSALEEATFLVVE